MVFQVPASKASVKQNRFEFTFPGSKEVHSIPLMKFLKPAVALRLNGMSEADAGLLLLNDLLPDVINEFEDTEQLEAFVNAWSEASGVTPGESPASAAS